MSDVKQYILDANIFIQASHEYYGFDLCPGFWKSLVLEHEKRRVFSIERVKSELIELNDDLKKWVEDTAPRTFFKKTDDISVITWFQKLSAWIQGQSQFTQTAKSEFATVADGWIIAYAKANGLVVVTHEEFAPEAKKKVPMPNVCVQFGVEYVNTFTMLKDLECRFVLRKQ